MNPKSHSSPLVAPRLRASTKALSCHCHPFTHPEGPRHRPGVAALAQDKARTGSVTVPRAHVERLEDGTEVKLGVFLSNSKSRRAKLTADKLQQLAALGLDWAGA